MTLASGDAPVPPPLFVVQEPYRPASTPADRGGWSQRSTDFYDEIAVPLADRRTGTSTVSAVLYALPVIPDAWIVAASIGPAYELPFRLMVHGDQGKAICAIVRQHWPDVWDMLVRSNEMTGGRVLMRLTLASEEQWLVADLVFTADIAQLSLGWLEDLLLSALSVAVRNGDIHRYLPGLLTGLAGPDRGTRVRAGLATLLGETVDVGEAVKEDGLAGLPQALLEVVLHRALPHM